MAISPDYRASIFTLDIKDEIRLVAQLQTVQELVKKDPKARPPMRYLILGLHDIAGSSKLKYDERRHPHVVEITHDAPSAIASEDELASFEKELFALSQLIVTGGQWHYDADTLWENLEALKLGRLIFPSLVKDE